METKEGDIFKSISDGVEFIVKKVMNSTVILESQDGKRHILTDFSSLKSKSFYLKKEGIEA